MKVCAHTLVKNEGRYLWFAVASVVPYVDKIMIWDTGSTDTTPEIMKALKRRFPDKVTTRTLGEVDINEFTEVHQEMLKETRADWILIVDGDEVWWNSSISKLRRTIEKRGDRLDSIGCSYFNLIGDIYHYQDESQGRYTIGGTVGHITIRAVNRSIPGLHFGRPHGQIGIFDGEGVLIQDLPRSRRVMLEKKAYLHFTHLPRASSASGDNKVPKRAKKLKYEIGKSFPLDFYYPEVFFRGKPDIIPSPWQKMDKSFIRRAKFVTPAKSIKRKVFGYGKKTGY